MNVIVVGAGHIGACLTELALQDGHNVTLIEMDEQKAREASEKYDTRVLHASIAEGNILEEAEADQADALIATTSDDAANLMAVFLGEEHRIKTLVSVVNHVIHRSLFERFNVHMLINPEMILAQHLYGFLLKPAVEDIISLPDGAEMFEITVAPSAPINGKTLAEAKQAGLLDEGLLIVLLKRGNQTIVPSGSVKLETEDHLTIFCQKPVSDQQVQAFTG